MNNEINNTIETEGYDEYEAVTFITDEGTEETFLHIMTFPYEGAKYAALVPEEQADEEEPEVLFVKVTRDDEGDAYIPVDNEVLLEELFTEFSTLLDESEGEESVRI
ncbi:MAG: DUF1292 domain-containing protein [Christensenellaceae bacterium]|nr:DUF1292 domain-containing protein [Christensenellaceae bacterium]